MLKLILLSIAIFQGTVVGVVLLRSPFFKSKTNQYLGFAMFSLSWSLLNLVLDITYTFELYPWLRVVDILDSAILFPILILLFVVHQVSQGQKPGRRYSWMLWAVLFSVAHSILDEVTEAGLTPEVVFYISQVMGGILFLFTLGFLPYILTITYRLTRRANNKQERAWLMSLWLFEVVIMVSWIMTILAGLFTETETPDLMVYIGLLATLFIHWVAYFGVYRFKLVNEQQRIRALLLNRRASIPANTSLATLPPREQNPRVTPPAQTAQKPRKHTEENEYFRELERLCAEEKVYRDSTLDRTKVAEMLGISPSYLSQLINEISGDNFSTYINRQRVEDVKQLIVDQEFDAYSLLSIGLECGFSSKTTYYNWFKEITGMTPNAYRKAHQ